MSLKVNQRVKLTNKNGQGIVKFIGNTSFDTGTWIGIVLDEPIGKNNGTIQNKSYFTCAENHGIFVRPNQVVLIDEIKNQACTRDNEPLNEFQLSSNIDDTNYLKLQETNIELVINIKNLQKELHELQKEHEKLQKIHDSDTEKLKEYEQVNLQHNELLEFKTNYQNLQRDLQRAQHDLVDLQNLQENHKKEMEVLSYELEMVTIDKEISENQNELIQDHLDQSREEVKQLRTDLSILREKINENNDKAVFITSNDYQQKHFEEDNKRLREALKKLREVLMTEKRNYKKSIKDLEIKQNEINELNKIQENLSLRINEQDNQIVDLEEQIEAVSGSEEMITLLTDQKLNLEERVVQLENSVDDLENLKEVLNQINEENHEIKKDLNIEIESRELEILELTRNNGALNEIIKDLELTVVKYRDLVQKLQTKLNNADEMLNQQTQNDSLIDNIEFQKIFNKSKEFEQNVDIELRQIHVQELLQHIHYLMLFLPNSFNNLNDILILLLIPKCDQKLDILLNRIHEKFRNVQKWDCNLIFTDDHYLKQFTFRIRFCTHVNVIQCLLHQYTFMLNTCSVNSFNKISEIYKEMVQQEQLFNHLLDLLKKNQLDENHNLDSLEQSVMYFYVMLPIVMESESVWNQLELLKDFLKWLNFSFNEFEAYIDLLKYLKVVTEDHEIDQLLNLCSNCLQKWYQQSKQIKQKLTFSDLQNPNLGFKQQDLFESVFNCYFYSLKLSKILLQIIEGALKLLLSDNDKIENDKLMELAIVSSANVYKQEDLGPLDSIKKSLDFITNRFDFFLEYFEENTLNNLLISDKNVQIDRKSPILIKAENFKNELEQVEHLREMVRDKDSSIQLMHTELKKLQESFGEMKLRKDMAEQKLSNAENYKDKVRMLLLEKDDLQIQFDTKCKEHENIYNNLKGEIEFLKKELDEYSIIKNKSSNNNDITQGSMDTILEEVRSLKYTLREVQSEKAKMTSNNLIERTERLKPIKYCTIDDLQEDNFLVLNRELNNIYNEVLSICTQYKIIDRNAPVESLLKFKEHTQKDVRYAELDKRFSQIKRKIGKELMRRQKNAIISTDLKDFPTIDLIESLNENDQLILEDI